MKRGFCAALAMGLLLSVWLAGAEETMLFLLIGQSNMAGRGQLPQEPPPAHPRIFMFNAAREWVPAKDPVHFDKPKMAGVGLCSSFARQVADRYPDARIGLIPCAMGGSALAEWMPGKKLYTNAVSRTRAALSSGGRLAGILWHQGEADSADGKRESYIPRFLIMLDRLRWDLDAQDVPVVLGELGEFYQPAPKFNAMLKAGLPRLPYCGLASSQGLVHRGDRLHFSSEALKTFGERYADEFFRLDALPRFRDGGFEKLKGNECKIWWPYGDSAFKVDDREHEQGAWSVVTDVKPGSNGGGVIQDLVYPHPDRSPIYFGGWSKAEDVNATDYCIYLDIWYQGGGNAWGKRADWEKGTHGWAQTKAVFYPEKPVEKIKYYAFVRNGTGKAWFDGLFLERREMGLEVLGADRTTDRPYSNSDMAEIRFAKPLEWSAAAGRAGASVGGKGTTALVSIDSAAKSLSLKLSDGTQRADVDVPLPEIRFDSVPPQRTVVWTADSLEKVTPLTFPDPSQLSAPKPIRIELARRERESAQVVVSTDKGSEWGNGMLELSPLRTDSGKEFKGSFVWQRVGYLRRRAGYFRHPFAPPDAERWLPDPLLPPAPFRVRRGGSQGLWLTVMADADATAGEYKGTVRVTDNGNVAATIPVTVRVREFSLPETFGMPTAFSVMDGFTRAHYPNRFEEMKRQSHDLMLDNRLNPDDISRTSPPEIKDLLHARSRGMCRFNILNLVPPPTNPKTKWVCWAPPEAVFTPEFYESVKTRLSPYVAELRKHGLQKFAYMYGFDERDRQFYAGIDEIWKKFRRDFPDIPVMTTAMMYRDMAAGKTDIPFVNTTDWFCPLTSVFRPELTEKLHSQGKQVWWYTCCGPTYPYANMSSYEYPLIEGRLLGWMTHLYGSDGLLFWHVNYWGDNPLLDDSDTFFPEWNTYSGLHMPGDGIFLYPARDRILPSIRLAQMRDAVEDYEWLQLLAGRKGKAAADVFSRMLVTSMTEFTRSPSKLRQVRSSLGDAIAR